MKALITGGAGFVGAHLAEALLERKDEGYVLDNLSTGSIENIDHLKSHPNFHYIIESASCPKTRTNSRPLSAGTFRIDASSLGSPREARILHHEHANKTLNIIGRRRSWLDPS